ncbi:MAG TPA: glycosyltransferase family 4 protein [Anaerolineales bacterium]
MRLLIINSEYPPVGGGAGNASANIARCLAQAGDEVTVITAAHGDLPADEMLEGVRVLRGPARRRHVDRSAAFEQVVFIWGAILRSLTVVRRLNPEAVVAFFGLPSGAAALFLKVTTGVPYIVSLRGGDVPGFRPYDFWLYHRIAVPLLRVIWHEAAAVVANSQGLRDLAHAFDDSIRIPVIPNGVDTQRYSMPERTWAVPRILSVGRVVHQKGLDLALVALGDLTELPWDWRIAGDGPQLDPLKSSLARRGLQDRVKFLGWTESDALIKEYQRANVFLFPSRHEGMPNAVLEAMASGLPVVATRIAGNEELVVGGETGLLVPPEDADALRDSLRALLGDASTRERMGTAARQRAVEKYSWAATAKRYRELVQQVVA